MNAETMASSPALASLRQQAGTWWQGRTPRERQAVAIVVVVLGLYAAWSVVVQPALRTVREAPAELDRLEAQYKQMQRVAAESVALRAAPRVLPAQASLALRSATDRLGEHGKLSLQGDRAVLTLTDASPEALRAWLVEVRSGAHAQPVEAQLQRGAQGYSGTLGLTLGVGS